MKTKNIHKIIILLATALLFASCSDNDGDGVEPELNPGIGEELSLKFVLPYDGTGMTKATETDSEIGERLVNGLRIVLYGENEPTIHHVWDCDIHIDHNGTRFDITGNDLQWYDYDGTFQNITIQTKATKQIPQDNYRMLIIVNPNDKIKELTDKDTGKTLADLDAPFNTTEENSLYQTWNGGTSGETVPAYFLMLNPQGLQPVVKGNFWPTKDKADMHPVKANVERVAAKIECNHLGPNTRSTLEAGNGRFVMHLGYDINSDDYDLPDWLNNECIYRCGGTYDPATKICNVCGIKYGFALGHYTDIPRYIVATDLMWQVDIINKKSYWYRHLANKKNGVMEQPGDNDTENFYAIDPNYTGFSGTTGLDDQFIYKTNIQYTDGKGDSYRRLTPANYTYSPYWSWTEGDEKTIYVPENTMDAADQQPDVMTRVVVKATLRREQIGLPEGAPPTSAPNIGDFFLFKGGAQGNSTYNMNNQYDGGTESNYFYLIPVDYLVKYKEDPTTIPVNLIGEDGDTPLTQAITEFETAHPGFNWTNISANTKPLESPHLIYYKNGEMHYQIPIKHFGDNPGENNYGRYGIVRNRGYQLNLLDILSVGSPTLPVVSSE